MKLHLKKKIWKGKKWKSYHFSHVPSPSGKERMGLISISHPTLVFTLFLMWSVLPIHFISFGHNKCIKTSITDKNESCYNNTNYIRSYHGYKDEGHLKLWHTTLSCCQVNVVFLPMEGVYLEPNPIEVIEFIPRCWCNRYYFFQGVLTNPDDFLGYIFYYGIDSKSFCFE